MAAFNFEKYGAHDDITVNKDMTKNKDASTISLNRKGGTSLATHTMYELDQGDQTTLAGTEGGDPEMPPLASYQAWESDWTAESTTTADREEDEIDAQVMTARKEERRHQEEILGNVAKNLKSNKSDAEQGKAVGTPPERAQPTINDENNAPTIAFIMAQMEVLRAKLAQMQA